MDSVDAAVVKYAKYILIIGVGARRLGGVSPTLIGQK